MAYDEKLAEAYVKWKRIKDTAWSPNAVEPPKPPIPRPDDEPDPIAVEPDAAPTKRGLWAFIKFLFNELFGRN